MRFADVQNIRFKNQVLLFFLFILFFSFYFRMIKDIKWPHQTILADAPIDLSKALLLPSPLKCKFIHFT